MESVPSPPDTPRDPLPAWVRATDALALGIAGLAVLVAGFGGFRLHLLGHRVSATSGTRILVAALVILLVRHAIRRDHPVHLRAWRSIAGWWAADGVRAIVPVWAASRLAVLLVGFLAVGTFGYRDGGAPFRLYKNEFLDLPARHDAGWYLGIAVDGYKWDPASVGHQNIAFMPALPMQAYAGRYPNPVLGEVAVEAADRGLQLRGAQFELPMTHWHLDSFLVEHPPWDLREFVEFHIGPEGEVRSFDLFGETFTPRAEAARP